MEALEIGKDYGFVLERDYRLVYESMGPGRDKDRKYLADKYGMSINNLADLNALGSMLYQRMTPAQQQRDLESVEADLSSAARALGSITTEKKRAASRINALKGGRPKGSGSLTALQKQVLDLRQSGLTVRQIADQLGRGPENVRQILARAARKSGIPGGWTAVGKTPDGE